MQDLPNAITAQKNKLSTPGSWLIFLNISFTGETTLNLVNNISDVVLGGTTYTKWAFGLGQVRETIKGDLPRVTLSLYDVGLTMRATLQANDGWSGGEVSVRRAFVPKTVGIKTGTDTNIIQYFTILDTVWDDSRNIINFNLGISTPLNKRFPRDRYVATICRHRFRGGFCRYGEEAPDGDMTTSFTDCLSKATAPTFVNAAQGDLAYIAIGKQEAFTDFAIGQKIRLEGTNSNDNEFIISRITQDALAAAYLILTSTFDLKDERHWNDGVRVRIHTVCDYSLTQCQANNNSHMYGASPGVAGGPYG